MPPNYADPVDVPYFFPQLPHPLHDHDHDHHDHDQEHHDYDHDRVLLEGALLRHSDPFPYLFLVAMEAGSMPRALLLLLLLPVSWLIAQSGHRATAFNLLLFVAVSGLRLKDVEAVARAVLPRFLSEDVSAIAWKKLCTSQSDGGGGAGLGRRLRRLRRLCVVTEWPRAFVEPFARYQLGAEQVLGSELVVAPRTGRCIGFVISSSPPSPPPPLLDQKLGLVSPDQKPAHGEEEELADLANPVVFHDGRLAQRPTPLLALLIFLWMPVGILLALFRLLVCGHFVPFRWWLPAVRMSGINIVVKGKLPEEQEQEQGGRLIVCNHRTLADPIMISIALGRPVTAVTYSLSRVSEMVAPITTVRLDRNAAADLKKLRHLVEEEGRTVVVCPEGTTGREPLLLRFSALFAEVTDRILPVAINTRVSLFHGTTVRGFKALDSFFFLMNPTPTYEIHFLEPLPRHATCGSGGVPRVDVANHVQRLIASSLGFRCSSFTRRDKYRFLVGSDGSVTPPSLQQPFSSVRG